jgi:hypothetical protein
MKRYVTAVLVFGAAALGASAAQQRPELSGTWALESSSGDMPGRIGGPANACGTARLGSGGGGPGPVYLGPSTEELGLKLTATSLAIERHFGKSIQKLVYSLAGTESVNRTEGVDFRTRTRWDGPKLVTEGSIKATDSNLGVSCSLVETMEIDKEGLLVVQTIRESPGGAAVRSRQTYARKKTDGRPRPYNDATRP